MFDTKLSLSMDFKFADILWLFSGLWKFIAISPFSGSTKTAIANLDQNVEVLDDIGHIQFGYGIINDQSPGKFWKSRKSIKVG